MSQRLTDHRSRVVERERIDAEEAKARDAKLEAEWGEWRQKWDEEEAADRNDEANDEYKSTE
jgi:hypothetical protein